MAKTPKTSRARLEAQRRYGAKNREKQRQYMAALNQSRREAGLCLDCAKPLVIDPGPRCDECRERQKRYNQDQKAKKSRDGNCSRCGKRKTVAGRKWCQECLDHNKSLMAARKDSKLRSGLCTRCGKVQCEAGRICEGCRKEAREYGSKRAKERLATGLCVKCGKEPHQAGKQRCARCERRDQDKAYLKRYGVTAAEVDAILIEQNGACALCGIQLDSRLVVDHCHDSAKVRGILCPECNIKLGHFEALVGALGLPVIQKYLKSKLCK